MTVLTLEAANVVAVAAMEKGRDLGLKPLCVAIVDPGSHLLAMQRHQAASTLRPQIAHGKAAGALALGISSRKIAGIAAERPTFIAALVSQVPFGLVPAAGGVIIVDAAGAIIGAVGVTGDTSDNDETCALAGIAAAGFAAQT